MALRAWLPRHVAVIADALPQDEDRWFNVQSILKRVLLLFAPMMEGVELIRHVENTFRPRRDPVNCVSRCPVHALRESKNGRTNIVAMALFPPGMSGLLISDVAPYL